MQRFLKFNIQMPTVLAFVFKLHYGQYVIVSQRVQNFDNRYWTSGEKIWYQTNYAEVVARKSVILCQYLILYNNT